MVSQNERARIIATWEKEPLYVAGTVIKCAACLLLLCGLAFVGAVTEPLTERTAQRVQSHQDRITDAEEVHTAHQLRIESAQLAARKADHGGELTATQAVALEASCQGVC